MRRTLWIVGAGLVGTAAWVAATQGSRATPTLNADAVGVRNASARNDGFTYRAIGSRGQPYPEWIRALKDKAGVYLIRDRTTGELVYIGSSAGRLYQTLTRHFQSWRRFKSFWRGQYGRGHDPGLTYDRSSVEVAVRLTTSNDAIEEEMRLIARMSPRDNLIGQTAAEDEVPF
ncbi:MAG: hypothetical protein QM831_44045 [Kofleriaceae bacterium]